MTRNQFLLSYLGTVSAIAVVGFVAYRFVIIKETLRREKIQHMFNEHQAKTRTPAFAELTLDEQHRIHREYLARLSQI